MLPENLYIGTSGWSYRWKGIFYPEDMPSADYLPFYANQFNTTEINSSHYHYTMVKTIQNWLAITPTSFRFGAKLHKDITHVQRLENIEAPLEKWMSRYQLMEERLGPVLVQIPASLRYDRLLAESFFRVLRQKYPEQFFAMEVRHKSWLEEEPLDLMREYEITFVIADSPRWPKLDITTTEKVYLRLHGEERLYSGPYSDEALERYAFMVNDWLLDGKEVWVYFNNTMFGSAVQNAKTLQQFVNNL
ncbi:DUF72 domain-containing protein [Adhaeribacter aquaticus]|uniref:DUF72 domain-containing protein n=1 Tax=Adhaeribacter aquaticus TaxID=299567 RepID=UPI00041ED9E2|nr:DUF72 domain-containing protein [Adhaeribacter aquaticus]